MVFSGMSFITLGSVFKSLIVLHRVTLLHYIHEV